MKKECDKNCLSCDIGQRTYCCATFARMMDEKLDVIMSIIEGNAIRIDEVNKTTKEEKK